MANLNIMSIGKGNVFNSWYINKQERMYCKVVTYKSKRVVNCN